jgi:hypothetical protein
MQMIKFNSPMGQQVALNPALVATIVPAGANAKSEPLTAVTFGNGSSTLVIGSLDYVFSKLSE